MLTPQTGRLTKILLLIALGILIAAPARLPIRTVTAQDLDYDEEFMKGRDLYRRGKFEDALKRFKRANELRDKKSAECYSWMSETYMALEAYKNAIECADKVIELAKDDRQLLVKAYNNKGLSLQELAERKDQKKLQAAEAIYRQGLAIEGGAGGMSYNFAVAILKMNRREGG